MQKETTADPASDISEWSAGARDRAAGVTEIIGVTTDQYAEDPLTLIPGLQKYVDRLPLSDFEQSDWIALHTDLTAYLGDLMVRRHNATWVKVSDSSSPTGYRYLIEATGIDGATYHAEPYDVAMEEFERLPIKITRMVANTEAVLHVTPDIRMDTRGD
ncbi:hypothetical protein [Streptomyces sp. NPDC002746]